MSVLPPGPTDMATLRRVTREAIDSASRMYDMLERGKPDDHDLQYAIGQASRSLLDLGRVRDALVDMLADIEFFYSSSEPHPKLPEDAD